MPAETPVLPVQTAIYQRLTGDSALMALVTGVYDGPPEGSAYDYIDIGDIVESPSNAHGQFGRDVVATLHVWSYTRGNAQPMAITKRVVELLDHQSLTVVGHTVVSVRHESTHTLRDINPDLRHVPIVFRIITEQD